MYIQCSSDISEPKYTRNTRQPNTRIRVYIYANARMHTAISINVVGSKLQAYATRPNGGLGIHWNLHICVDENYESLFLCVKPERARSECACSHESFSVAFLLRSHTFNYENSS